MVSKIFEYFLLDFEYFYTIFVSFYAVFVNSCKFLNVFERFFLAYFTQTSQINPPNPVFESKTHLPPEKNRRKSQFFNFFSFSFSKCILPFWAGDGESL
jgi:hypothetical protein